MSVASTSYLLAIDIGQTSTALWMASADLSRSATRAIGGFKHHIESGSQASGADLAHAITSAVADLSADLRCPAEQVPAACCSVSGAPVGVMERLQYTLPRADIRMISDAEAAYLGTLWRTPGITLIAGTGSVAFGMNGDKRAVLGGWGYLFGDEGGASGLARAGVMAAIASWERRGPETELMPRLLDLFGVDSYRTLVAKVYSGQLTRAQLGRAAPVVIQLAEAGDAVARAILRRAAAEHADYLRAGAAQLGLGHEVQVGYAGGVLSKAAALRDAIEQQAQLHGIHVTRWVPGSSLTGAARLASEAMGLPMTQERLAALFDATARIKHGVTPH